MNELSKWAVNTSERSMIDSFWSWLLEQYNGSTRLCDVHLGNAIDEYHGIDRKKLEAERRQLVERLDTVVAVECKASVEPEADGTQNRGGLE